HRRNGSQPEPGTSRTYRSASRSACERRIPSTWDARLARYRASSSSSASSIYDLRFRAVALPPLRPAAFFWAVVPPCDASPPEPDFLPPCSDDFGALAILAARSLEMPLSLRASYFGSILMLGRFVGIALPLISMPPASRGKRSGLWFAGCLRSRQGLGHRPRLGCRPRCRGDRARLRFGVGIGYAHLVTSRLGSLLRIYPPAGPEKRRLVATRSRGDGRGAVSLRSEEVQHDRFEPRAGVGG